MSKGARGEKTKLFKKDGRHFRSRSRHFCLLLALGYECTRCLYRCAHRTPLQRGPRRRKSGAGVLGKSIKYLNSDQIVKARALIQFSRAVSLSGIDTRSASVGGCTHQYSGIGDRCEAHGERERKRDKNECAIEFIFFSLLFLSPSLTLAARSEAREMRALDTKKSHENKSHLALNSTGQGARASCPCVLDCPLCTTRPFFAPKYV